MIASPVGWQRFGQVYDRGRELQQPIFQIEFSFR
jgi:hypothetical protein